MIKNLKKFEIEVILAFVFGMVISSLVAFWGDWRETINEMLAFRWWWAIPILLLTCFNYFLRFVRWHFLLTKAGFKNKIHPKKSGLIFLSGLPLTLSPGKTGEVLKAYFLKKITGDHLSRTVPIVVTERLTDGLGALLLLAFGLSSYSLGIFAFAFAAISCLVFIFLIYHEPFWQLIKKLIPKVRWLRSLSGKLFDFREVLKNLIGWKNLLLSTLLAAAAWFSEAIGLSIIINQVSGLGWGINLLSKSVFIFCFVSILGFVSLLPGGLGVAEGGFVGSMILLLGLARPEAAATTLLLRLLTLWWGVAIGLVAFIAILKSFKRQ